MTKTLTIAVVSAGLSNPSSTALLADQITAETRRQLDAAADVQIQVERIELRELGNAIMQYFLTGIPTPTLDQAHATLARAHGVITATPIFKASYSGLLSPSGIPSRKVHRQARRFFRQQPAVQLGILSP